MRRTVDVEKIAVVRNQHEGVRIISQILFQPVAGFEIEVIGRFVEQQQVGLFEQQFGQRDAHLPAAGKLLGAALPVALAEAEAAEHDADLGFDGVAVARAEFALRAMKAVRHGGVFGAGRIELTHARSQLLLFFFERPQLVEDGHTLCEHRAPGKRKPFLRQIADGDAALSVIEPESSPSIPASTFSSDDLPVPLAPTMPVRSFGVTSQSASSKRILGP